MIRGEGRAAHASQLHWGAVREPGVAGLGNLLCLALQIVEHLNVGLDCAHGEVWEKDEGGPFLK